MVVGVMMMAEVILMLNCLDGCSGHVKLVIMFEGFFYFLRAWSFMIDME